SIVAMWNRELSTNELNLFYNSTKDRFKPLSTLNLYSNLSLYLTQNSYSSLSSSEIWYDVVNNNNFVLVANTTATTPNPTFTTVQGLPTKYWSFDGGDFFTLLDANPALIENFHKVNANGTIAAWI